MRILFTMVTTSVLASAFHAPAQAASTVSDITPDNVANQPLGLRITSEAHNDDMVSFDVYVSPGRNAISPRREGRLEIARDTLTMSHSKHGANLQPPIVWCAVREVQEDEVLHFRFGLAREFLSKASFQFRNYEPHGMPSMDVYRVLLGEFAPSE